MFLVLKRMEDFFEEKFQGMTAKKRQIFVEKEVTEFLPSHADVEI